MKSEAEARETISVRIRPSQLKEVRLLVNQESSTLSSIMDKLVKIGLKNWDKDAYRKD